MSPTESRFDTVLIANRGEIALRIIRAAQAEGLRTVAVYSDADGAAPHVSAADAAVNIGPGTAAQSYLAIPNIITAALRSGAQAVHPGYGFLSERGEFARACVEAGLVFVGPPADVIELMGRKDSARGVAVAAGVPVVPAAVSNDPDELLSRAADQVGFPMLIKAAAGGGGKGMRIVRRPADLQTAIGSARREAMAAFGDDTVLIERYVERGRHVEVQILADEHGAVLHLFERDCSSQRRYQKVVEEAPAPTISGAMRTRLAASAVDLARHAGYVNAGTVEFLVDSEAAYLLEMNTRLQVEHPVTELVTGRDLVRLQLHVAQGHPLPFTQAEVSVTGHAMEARIYAEDPATGFLPQSGVASAVRWPAGARVDEALRSGQAVSQHYDPMLAKVIVHGPSRELARRALVKALDETVVQGLSTNIGFLRRLVASAEFSDGRIDTSWLDAHPGMWTEEDEGNFPWLAAAWLTSTKLSPERPAAMGASDGWRLSGPPSELRVDIRGRGRTRTFGCCPREGMIREAESCWEVRDIADCVTTVDGLSTARLEIGGERRSVSWSALPSGIRVTIAGCTYEFQTGDLPSESQVVPDGTRLVAPMPGTVTAVLVSVGDEARAGQLLGVMEAMKMEHQILSHEGGVITNVRVNVGDQVPRGHVLFEVEVT